MPKGQNRIIRARRSPTQNGGRLPGFFIVTVMILRSSSRPQLTHLLLQIGQTCLGIPARSAMARGHRRPIKGSIRLLFRGVTN